MSLISSCDYIIYIYILTIYCDNNIKLKRNSQKKFGYVRKKEG